MLVFGLLIFCGCLAVVFDVHDGWGDCIERGMEWTSINIICATNKNHINTHIIINMHGTTHTQKKSK